MTHCSIKIKCLIALVMISSANSASAITRWIYDCGDFDGTAVCYLDYHQDGYFYGRSEGQPPRGPNPLGPPYTGSTDVDILYDMAGQYQDYLMAKFGRNGPNGLGGTGNGTSVASHITRVFANARGSSVGEQLCTGTVGLPAALATTTTCILCTGSATPDVFAHEMTHILYNRELGLSPGSLVGEAGAINEGMADIFAESFERYLTGSNDWIIGTGHPIHVRNLGNPPNQPQGAYPSPDRYLSPDFYTGTDDAGGIHINAGVLGKGTYLASEGGEFNGYTITGIGFDKVEQIWYRALTEYFVAGETFNLAYAHLIQAADDLYDEFEVGQITLALQAVEMNLSRAGLTGDFDNDGDVDGRDFLLWQRGESPNPWNHNDLAAWQANYEVGVLSALTAIPPAEAGSPVPEPGSFLMLSMVAGLSYMRRRAAFTMHRPERVMD